MCDGVGRRGQERALPARQHRTHILARNPDRVFQLVAVDRERVVLCLADAGDHQLAGEGPGLAGDVADRADAHASLLHHLAPYRLFDRLARFQKARQRGVAAGRKGGLAAEQHAIVMLRQHDDDGVDAREMLGGTGGAGAAPARPEGRGRRAAIGAEAVARMPVEHGARRAPDRRRVGPHPVDRGGQRARAAGRTPGRGGEVRDIPFEPEQHQRRVRVGFGEAAPFQPAVRGQSRQVGVHPQQPRARVRDGRRQGFTVVAQRVGAVERAAGEADPALLQGLSRVRSLARARPVSCASG